MAAKSGNSSTILYSPIPGSPHHYHSTNIPCAPAQQDRPDMDGIPRKQYGSRSNARRGASASTSSSKRKGKAAAGGGGKTKPPIKVVYIGNPMRVTTSESGFRALVQELTGRHADPYKYSGGSGSAAIDVDGADDSSGGSLVGLQSGALASPVSTPSSDAASAGGAAHASVPAACNYYDDDDEDSFAPQLIDNSYSVFSPPTFLYGPHGDGEL